MEKVSCNLSNIIMKWIISIDTRTLGAKKALRVALSLHLTQHPIIIPGYWIFSTDNIAFYYITLLFNCYLIINFFIAITIAWYSVDSIFSNVFMMVSPKVLISWLNKIETFHHVFCNVPLLTDLINHDHGESWNSIGIS